jgi:hypothetical protein
MIHDHLSSRDEGRCRLQVPQEHADGAGRAGGARIYPKPFPTAHATLLSEGQLPPAGKETLAPIILPHAGE